MGTTKRPTRVSIGSTRRHLISGCLLVLAGCREDPNAKPRLAEGTRLLTEVGLRIEHDLAVLGGTSPFTFALRTGDEVWPGIGLASDGRISGVPTEPGRASVAIIVTDAEGEVGEGRIGLEVSDPLHTRGSPDCLRPHELTVAQAPPALSVVSGRFPSAEGDAVLFYSFTLAQTARARLSSNSGAHFRLGPEACSLDGAAASTSVDALLDPGSWTFAVHGPGGTTFSFALIIEESTSSFSCPAPLPAPLLMGRQSFVLSAPDLIPNEHVASCDGALSGELALGFTLDETSDLDVELLSGSGTLVLRRGDCRGEELECKEGSVLSGLRLEAGRYTLIVEQRFDSSVEIAVTRYPPAERPSNDRCAQAEVIDLSAGTATIEGEFAAAAPDGRECGETRPLYYRVTLDTASDLHVETEDAVYVGLLDASCNALLDCSWSSFACTGDLGAGDHILRLTPDDALVRGFRARVFATPRPVLNPPINDTCEEALVLDSAPGYQMIEASVLGATRQLSSCSPTGGELFYRLDLTERSDVQLSGGPFDILPQGCGGAELECQQYGFQQYGLGPGSLWFAVEHDPGTDPFPNFGDCLNEELRVSFGLEIQPSPPLPPNADCASALVVALTASTTVQRISGTTLGAYARASSACSSFAGERLPVVVYALETEVMSRWRITETTGLVRAELRLNTICEADGALECSNFDNRLETSAALLPGRYYLHVSTDQPSDFSLVFEQLGP